MIVKVENGNFVRWDDCISACIVEDINYSENEYEYLLVCRYKGKMDATYPLNNGDKVYFMNEQGKTIDQDFRCFARTDSND